MLGSVCVWHSWHFCTLERSVEDESRDEDSIRYFQLVHIEIFSTFRDFYRYQYCLEAEDENSSMLISWNATIVDVCYGNGVHIGLLLVLSS